MQTIKFLDIKTVAIAACAAFLAFQPLPGHAQDDSGVDILPAKAIADASLYSEAENTHPPLRITPDKSELVRLDQEAGTIIVGNPAHLSVLADNSKTLVFVPQIPGATYVTILDQKNEILMQRHVIVAAPEEKYVRIRRSCAAAGDEACTQTQVYYCPDMCHEVIVTAGEQEEESGQSDLESLAESVEGLNNFADTLDSLEE